jgi:hypothetical protein
MIDEKSILDCDMTNARAPKTAMAWDGKLNILQYVLL